MQIVSITADDTKLKKEKKHKKKQKTEQIEVRVFSICFVSIQVIFDCILGWVHT